MKKLLSRKQTLLLGAATIIVLGSVLVAYRHFHKSIVAGPTATPTSPVNYGPPTQEEKDQAQARKDEIASQGNTTTDTGKKAVTPIITNASQIDQQVTVNAYISGIFENSGTCTATFTKGSLTITKNSEAFANASTTDCTPFRVDRSEFSNAGDWQVSVSYSSSTASGTSQPKTLKLQ